VLSIIDCARTRTQGTTIQSSIKTSSACWFYKLILESFGVIKGGKLQRLNVRKNTILTIITVKEKIFMIDVRMVR
jgi:hypothetical protein